MLMVSGPSLCVRMVLIRPHPCVFYSNAYSQASNEPFRQAQQSALPAAVEGNADAVVEAVIVVVCQSAGPGVPATFGARGSATETHHCRMKYAKRSHMTRETLHEMIDRIPESEIVTVQKALDRFARDAAFRSALSAPPDDEPVTAGDAEAIARAWADVRAGRVVSHDDVLREFGIR